mgnify:FL=1
MATVKLKFSQFSERANSEIGFIVEEDTNIQVSLLKMKEWAALQLYYWFQYKELIGVKTFYKSKPIKIEASVDSKIVGIFMQIRVTKDTIVKEDKDVLFPFLENQYLLTTYSETKRQSKNVIAKKKLTP